MAWRKRKRHPHSCSPPPRESGSFADGVEISRLHGEIHRLKREAYYLASLVGLEFPYDPRVPDDYEAPEVDRLKAELLLAREQLREAREELEQFGAALKALHSAAFPDRETLGFAWGAYKGQGLADLADLAATMRVLGGFPGAA